MSPERFGEIETPRPMLKDLIRLDNRWAQYLGKDLVKFLDTGDMEKVDLNQYLLKRKIDLGFKNFIDSGEPGLPSGEEVENINPAGTRLGELTVFGDYEKLSEQ